LGLKLEAVGWWVVVVLMAVVVFVFVWLRVVGREV